MKIRWADALLDLLFPPRCVFCGRVSDNSGQCCTRCSLRLRLEGEDCRRMLGKTVLYSVFRYTADTKRMLHAFKFNGKRELGEYLADEMTKLLKAQEDDLRFEAVTYMPMPALRERGRGYNQARLLAEEIARRLGLPCHDCGLRRNAVFAQHDLHLSMRKKQRDAGCIMEPGTGLCGRILLVDDLCTSGSSILGCAALLRGAGACEVVAVTALLTE